MPDKAVYLLVVEGFADWEPAHAVAELRRNGNYRVESVGLTRDPVVSMGGIRVLPSKSIVWSGLCTERTANSSRSAVSDRPAL